MDLEMIAIEVLKKMGGQSHSEDLLFVEVLNEYPQLVDYQLNIKKAISNLVKKGIIVHEKQMPLWIRLNQ